jgi:hypothetical protein
VLLGPFFPPIVTMHRPTEEERLEKFFDSLRGWMPEPPSRWRENAIDPVATRETQGKAPAMTQVDLFT